jgi:hypothetical protein
MVADAVKHIVHTIIMFWLMRRQVGGLSGHGVRETTVKSVLAAALTGLSAFGTAYLLSPFLTGATLVSKLGLVAGGGAAGLVAFSAVVYVLNMEEAKSVPQLLFKRNR